MKYKKSLCVLSSILIIGSILLGYGCSGERIALDITVRKPFSIQGNNGTIFLAGDGTVYTQGTDLKGSVLGQGEGVEYSSGPVPVLTDVVKIYENTGGARALRSDGGLWVWGNNRSCLIGLPPDQEYVYEPVKLMDGVADISFKNALKSNGELWGWGYNAYVDINTGKITASEPVKIMDGVIKICEWGSGYYGAIKSDGGLWLWGGTYHASSRGNGTTFEEEGWVVKPVKILDNAKECSMEEQILAVTEDGTLYTWGNNEYGQCGNGEHGDFDDSTGDCVVTVPTKIMDNVASVKAAMKMSFAVTNDGELWGWGVNDNDIFGTGNDLETKPVKICDHVKEFIFPFVSGVAFIIDENDDLYALGGGFAGATATGIGWSIDLLAAYKANALSPELVEELDDCFVSAPVKILEDVETVFGGNKLFFAKMKNGTYRMWGFDDITRVETYGEANYIVFEDGSKWARGGYYRTSASVLKLLGGDDEEITNGAGYFLQLFAEPVETVFPPRLYMQN